MVDLVCGLGLVGVKWECGLSRIFLGGGGLNDDNDAGKRGFCCVKSGFFRVGVGLSLG